MAENKFLNDIIAHKKAEIEERKQHVNFAQIQEWADDGPARRPFLALLRAAVAAGRAAVIAEIKRASPIKGVLRENFDPIQIARSYQLNGATCLSVLTDHKFFKGSGPILELARNACALPVLRKDFIIDPYQVYETRVYGADCLLLIVAALSNDQLQELYTLAKQLRLDVLIEVHDEAELKQALVLKPDLVGINNRNLHTFETNIQTTLDLLPQIPQDCFVVTESGVLAKEDVTRLRAGGINCFLVGEAFMRAKDPGVKLRELFFS